jgi:phosphoribosylanthranilate isomerase
MTKVKICGITTPDDAFAASEAGADAVGMIFFEGSPRRVDIETAQRIARVLPPFVSKVGVFVNALRAQIDQTVEKVGLDSVQLSGDEAPGYVQSIKSASVIKAIRVAGPGDAELAMQYYDSCSAIVLDAKVEGAYGGTGQTFDWSLVLGLMRADFPTIIAGGLTPENVGDVVRRLMPYGVDCSSGVEWEPGVKDHNRVRRFVEEVRRADVEALSR